MKKQVPYNTGKVEIGKDYIPPKRIEMSDSMLLLQRALLEDKTKRRAEAAADFALYIVACIAVIVMVLTWR